MKKLFVGIVIVDIILIAALAVYFIPALGAIVGIIIGSLISS